MKRDWLIPGLYLGWWCGILTVALVSCAVKDNTGIKARISSPDTSTSGVAEGPSGDVDASEGGRSYQTIIGTVAVNGGWFCAPVALLALLSARTGRRAVDRIVDSLEVGRRGLLPRDDPSAHNDTAANVIDEIKRLGERRRDAPERFIARSVRKLKKGKT